MAPSTPAQELETAWSRYLLNVLLCLVAIVILFRAILPQIPRFFLRGKLRVQCMGFGGVSGIEWRSNGFKRSSFCPTGEEKQGESVQGPDGFVLKIQRIYLSLGQHPGSSSAEIDHNSHQTGRGKRSWLTINVQGVGLRIPRSPTDECSKQKKLDEAKKRAAEEKEAANKAQEEEDMRLEALVRGDSSTAMPTSTDSQQDEIQCAADTGTSSIRSTYCWITMRAYPVLKSEFLRYGRAILLLMVSSLPALMSFISVEVHHIEVYLQEVESVVRIDRAGLELAVALVSDRADSAFKCPAAESQQGRQRPDCYRKPYRRFSEAIANVGTSAKGAASSLTAGLPAGKGTFRLHFRSLEIFEASPPSNETSHSSKSSSRRSSEESSPRTPRFTSDTGWAKDRQAAIDPIPESSKIISLPEVTRFEVGMRVGPSLRLGGREAIETSLDLSKADVGLDALYRIVRIVEDRKALRSGPMPTVAGASGDRSTLSRHFAQQRKEPAAKALTALRSLSITLPQISFKSDTVPRDSDFTAVSLSKEEQKRLPSTIEVEAVIKGIKFSLGDSDPNQDKHRRWLGTCGTHNNRPIEHRRAFLIDAGITSVQLSCRVDRQRVKSEFIYLDQLNVHVRSTWTPFGLFPASSEAKEASRRYFQGDPNEQTLLAEVTLKKIRGDVKLDCAAALLTFVEMRKAERNSVNRRLNIDAPSTESKFDSLLHHVPKVAIGMEIGDISYRLDSGRALSVESAHDSSLMIKVPATSVVLHGSYRDAYIRRGDRERAAAWRALERDEVEWSLKSNYQSEGPGATSPVLPSAGFSAFVGRVKEQLSPGSQSRSNSLSDQRSRSSSPSPDSLRNGNLTIEEAISKMKDILKTEEEEKNADAERTKLKEASHLASDDHEIVMPATATSNKPGPQTVKVSARHARRASLAQNEDCGIIYDFESNFYCPSIDSFFVFTGKNSRDRERNKAKDECSAPGEHQLTRRQLFAINNIDISASGTVPGIQELGTNKPILRLVEHHTKVRAFIEEIDVELWHPSVFEAIIATLREIQIARRPFVTTTFAQEHPNTGEKMEQPSTFAMTPKIVHLIDRYRPGLDFWLSIGGMLAHVGGNDPKCDPHLCRGVGFEARRVVAEFVCQKKSPDLLTTKPDWGARSALLLPEDLVMSTNALTLRHGKAAVGKISLYEIGLFPVLDMEEATRLVKEDLNECHETAGRTQRPSSPAKSEEARVQAIFGDAIWDFHDRQPRFETSDRRRFHQEDRQANYIFWMPYSATKVTIRPPAVKPSLVAKRADELTIESDGTRLLSFRIQLLHTYCILIAFAALQRLKPESPVETTEGGKPMETEIAQPVPKTRLAAPSFCVDLGVADVHVFVDLPDDVNLFLHIRRLDLRWTEKEGAAILWESLMAAVESPRVTADGLWEEMVRLRDWKISINPHGGPDGKLKVIVDGDGGSVRVPYGYVVFHIIDNSTVAFKATKQLVHQFVKGGEDSVIIPVGEDPKHLPFVDLKIRILTIEAQDDPIETRLNIIWRAGGDENRMRLEREEAFAAKIAKREEERRLRTASKSSPSINSSRDTSRSRSNSIHSTRSHTDTTGSDSESDSEKSFVDLDEHIQEARRKLDAYNSSSWVRRYANARAEQGKREEAIVKGIFGRFSHKVAVGLPIEMVQPARASPLFRSTMSKVKISIGPPTFSEGELRDWMHEQGKGTPRDLPYSLLVPLHLRWTLAEWRWELRDYPLPLLHIPPLKSEQGDQVPAFELSGDICLAEHLSEGMQSIRHVPAIIVPAAAGHPHASEFGINVPKVTMPVKLYGSPVVNINSVYPTRFAWGQSMQPAIADMIRVFDGMTSPPPDPSPKLGFWDKLPLIMQGRIHLRWKEKGELHFYLKGSRDPYSLFGNGAGWVKCWRGDVEIRLGFENEDKEFLQFISDEFILAIPDLRDYYDRAAIGTGDKSSLSEQESGKDSSDTRSRPGAATDETKESSNGKTSSLASDHTKRYMREPNFSKICIKLTNGVRWGISLRHEHTCCDETCKATKRCSGDNFYRACRLFDRRPHWTVIQRSKEYMNTLAEEDRRDSFYGWRSDFGHLGVSIYSPKDGLVVDGVRRGKSGGINNLYFSPLGWQHFWAWLRLFDSSMGLPIRQGSLFPSAPPPSPKFARSLATIKYRFNIAPLFIAHLYHLHSRSDWAKGLSTLLGIKARVGVFHVDMHQRLQETIKERTELQEAKKVFHKPFYEAEADFSDIDLRTLVGRFRDSAKRLVEYDDVDADAEENTHLLEGDSEVGEEDLDWVDLNDFVEVDYTPCDEEPPEIRLIQALTCPRFNFYRRFHTQSERREQGSGGDREDSNTLEESKFGNEDPETHTCLIGKAPLNFHVQMQLANARIDDLKGQIEHLELSGKDSKDDLIADLQKRINIIEDHCSALKQGGAWESEQWKTNQGFTSDLSKGTDKSGHLPAGERQQAGRGAYNDRNFSSDEATDVSEIFKDLDTFDDRFFVHSPVFIFTNQTRHVILRYYGLYKKRKGFVHHMTARAIYNIRQLSKHLENDKSKRGGKAESGSSSAGRPAPSRQETSKSKSGSELLTGLLDDTKRYVLGDSQRPQAISSASSCRYNLSQAIFDTHVNPAEGLSDLFDVHRSNFCVFIKPQIVMKSEIDDSSIVILTAIRTRLQNFSVVDPTISDEDSVNRRVLSRNYFSLDGLQAFHPVSHSPASTTRSHHARGKGSDAAVPLETLIDLRHETGDFDRIVSRTDASLRYDKFNRLRLHDSTRPITSDACNEDPSLDHLRHYMDLLRVRCPRFAVSANSIHFGALYNIVTDLILYRSPSWQERAKQLETILFSYDFKDTSLLAEIVTDLQTRIRRALELDAEYQFHFDDLNKEGKADMFTLKAELSDLVDELLLIADAITESEDAKGEEDKDKKSALRLEAHAQDLSWNMMGEQAGDLLAKLSIKGPSFTWLNKADNSTANSLSIIDLQAVDVRPDAHFAEIITKWNRAPHHPMAKQGRFVNAVWSEMAPVGGISVVDQFEFDVHPLHLQLEIKTGRLIMGYIFGSKRHREKEEEKRRKLLERQAETSTSPRTKKRSAFARLTGGRPSTDTARESSEAPTPSEDSSSRRNSMSSTNTDRQSIFRNSKAVSQTTSTSSESRLYPPDTKKNERIDRTNENTPGASEDEEDLSQFAIAKRNAEEMRQRAASNLTFLLFRLPETVFCLSYKGAKEKSITDVYDLVFKAPTIEYRNRTWSYEDLVQHIKKDVFRAAWGQRTTIVKSILAHRPKRPEALRHIREKQIMLLKGSKETRGASPLQLQVQPPTPRVVEIAHHGGESNGAGSEDGEMTSSSEPGSSVASPIITFNRQDDKDLGGNASHPGDLRPHHLPEGGDLSAVESSAKSAPAKFSRFLHNHLHRDRSRDSMGSSGSRNGVRSPSRSPSISVNPEIVPSSRSAGAGGGSRGVSEDRDTESPSFSPRMSFGSTSNLWAVGISNGSGTGAASSTTSLNPPVAPYGVPNRGHTASPLGRSGSKSLRP